jgi:hypothetical protein
MIATRSAKSFLLVLIATAAALGCEGLLDVENPGSINDEDIRNADAADLWVNGSLRKVQRGWDNMLSLLSPTSDELRWRGRFAWWGQLDRGDLDDPGNSALNRFRGAAAAQWMADEAIHVLDSLDAADGLGEQRTGLALAYLYGAIAYATIADGMEDYAPSDRTEPGPALGPENMGSLYDKAVEHATSGLAIQTDGELGRNLFAARARARHAAQVWRRIRPAPADTSGGGLIADGGPAAADALAALAMDGSDWRYQFRFAFEVIVSLTAQSFNCPAEMRIGERYAVLDMNGLAEAIVLMDPIDGVPDPWLERLLLEELPAAVPCDSPNLTVFSAREMHLIVAEHALAEGDLDTFAEHVSLVRSLEGLTPWTPDSGVTARHLLIYERQSQLFLMGRRLADMYRFGIQSDTWDPGSVAAQLPGTLFPIPTSEIEANCYLNGSCG